MLKNRLFDLSKNTIITDEIDIYKNLFTIKVTTLDQMIVKEDQIEIHNKVEKLLDMLTGRQREAIYLRFIQEMSYDEIASLLDMTPQATRNLVFRAIERIIYTLMIKYAKNISKLQTCRFLKRRTIH